MVRPVKSSLDSERKAESARVRPGVKKSPSRGAPKGTPKGTAIKPKGGYTVNKVVQSKGKNVKGMTKRMSNKR